MKIEFHIDQINEMLKYLDEVPHRWSRSIVDFIQAHIKKHIESQQPVAETQQTVAETQQPNASTTETH
jgi:hypothetical protein